MMDRREEVNYREALDYAEAYHSLKYAIEVGNVKTHTYKEVSLWWPKKLYRESYRRIIRRDDDAIFIGEYGDMIRKNSLTEAEAALRAIGYLPKSEWFDWAKEFRNQGDANAVK